jgi:hypothetical protein
LEVITTLKPIREVAEAYGVGTETLRSWLVKYRQAHGGTETELTAPQRARLLRDYYVRVLGNDYFIGPRAIGRMVTVRANLEHVTATVDGQCVASHARAWGSGQTITDPAHVAQARWLREQFQKPRAVPDYVALVRDLADYDTAFGVHIEGISAGWTTT